MDHTPTGLIIDLDRCGNGKYHASHWYKERTGDIGGQDTNEIEGWKDDNGKIIYNFHYIREIRQVNKSILG